MREIKFRAWFDDKMIKPMSLQKMIHQKDNTIPLKVLEKEIIFMQYTGLKIKDIEVYEGDIIKARKDYCYKVVFENGSFVLYHTNKYDGIENIRWGVLGRFFDADMKDILNECKVIGNIYENPELLNK